MSDDPVKRICQAWARADYGDECFWEVWPECPTEESLTPNMVLATLEAQAAEIERLRGALAKLIGGAETALEAWNHHMRDVVVPASLHDAIEELRADVVEALTGSATVKESLTTEDEKQSHEWKCPIDYPGCRKNCGNYGCGN